MGMDEEVKKSQILENLHFPTGYKLDKDMLDAIEFYKKRSTTVVQTLYEGAVIAALDVNAYLRSTKELLEERSEKGGVVTSLASITTALKSVPDIMTRLRTAEKELVKEQKETEGRMKGSKQMGMFEDGF